MNGVVVYLVKEKYVPMEPWVVQTSSPLGTRQAINEGEEGTRRGRCTGRGAWGHDDKAEKAAVWECKPQWASSSN